MQPGLIYVVYICKDFLNENMWLQLVTSKEFHNYIKLYILFLISNIHLVIFPLFYSSVCADAPWKVNVLSALLSQAVIRPTLRTNPNRMLFLANPKDGMLLHGHEEL